MTFMDKIVIVSIAGVSLVCVVAMLYNIRGSRTNVADSLHQQFMDEDVRESVTEVEEVDNDTSGPEFIGGVKNVTVSEGGNATFTCTLARRGSYKVAWIHVDTRAVLSVHKLVISANPRLSVSQHDSRGGHSVWQLHIREVEPGDAGQYECQVNTEQAIRSAGHLRVVGQQKLQCVEDGWHLLKSSKMCYKHVDKLKTWRLARKYCERFGGHLACASNVEINNFLTTLFPKSRKHGWADNNVYLGAEKKDGQWIWTDGSHFNFTAWAPGSPSGGEKHIELIRYPEYERGEWNDRNDDENSKRTFICQEAAVPIIQ